MPKKGGAASKAAKKAKALQKTEKKETKNALKAKEKSKSKKNDSDSDDDDLEGILERMRKEWEIAHTVTEEIVEGPPSQRANATLTACPNGSHLWCIGGEFFSEDGKAYFYNDVFRYAPEKNEWKKFVSPTCPGPRSAHAVVASPAGGGKLFLFGGEFSSLHQSSFHHYRDFWSFDIPTHSWDRIETKIRPTARSGHRMAIWKHLIILFGGFYDPGITTRYLNDLWVFDTQEYTWTLVEFRPTESRPSPRSGFSFLPCADGIILHGGYCKEYSKGKRPVGVCLEDTWLLKITLPTETAPPTPSTSSTPPKSGKFTSTRNSGTGGTTVFKWERRKRPSDAYAPCLRSGCTMALWAAKGVGVLFGGVTDEDTSEERLDSVFWNDLYGYHLAGKGKWISMTLRKPKAKGKKASAKKAIQKKDDSDKWDRIDADDSDDEIASTTTFTPDTPSVEASSATDDPLQTTPLPRYNAMLAVLKNTLYIYGGIFEKGSREYTMDDFYSLQLDKMDRYICLKKSEIIIPEGEVESSSDEDSGSGEGGSDQDSDGSERDEDVEYETETLVGADEYENIKDCDKEMDRIDEDHIRVTFAHPEAEIPSLEISHKMKGLAVEEDPVPEIEDGSDVPANQGDSAPIENDQNTPRPGETLTMFFARTREYWTQEAMESGETDRKQLRRIGFQLSKERYDEYAPTLQKLEKILEEAGLDAEEIRRGSGGGTQSTTGPGGMSRNRR